MSRNVDRITAIPSLASRALEAVVAPHGVVSDQTEKVVDFYLERGRPAGSH